MRFNTLIQRNIIAPAVILLLASSPSLAADTWNIDAVHSNIGFSVKHFVSRTHGRFKEFKGTIQADPANLKAAMVDVEIQAASVTTDNEKRDGHLKTPDFFDVAKYPTLNFKSKEVKPADAETGILVGDLTINGVTKPVELSYTILGFGPDGWGNERGGFEATGKVNRKDFNVNWNKALDTGGFVLGDEVTLQITVEAVKEKPEAEKTEKKS